MSRERRYEQMGLLEEKKREAIELSVEIHGLREQINRATDEHRAIQDLALDELSVIMQRFQEKTSRHRQLCDEIRSLAEDLNVPMPSTDVRRKR